MTTAARDGPVAADYHLAARLFLHHPAALGGLCLHGFGPVRDALVEQLVAVLGKTGPVVKIPINVDAEQLLGGIDLAATLASGRSVARAGLLAQASGGVLLIPMAERMAQQVSAPIAQAMDQGDLAVILLDDAVGDDDAPPSALMERVAFHCDLGAARSMDRIGRVLRGRAPSVEPLSAEQRAAIVTTAAACGVASVRPLLFVEKAARAAAALSGRDAASDDDIAVAVQLVLGPRATQQPPRDDATDEAPPPDRPDDQPGENDRSDEDRPVQDLPLDDMLLDAVAAAIPPDLLDRLSARTRASGTAQAGRAGQKQKSARRGRPLGARAGVPGHGRKLALIDSLRAAAPWQATRRATADAGAPGKIHIRKSDLRVRHYEQRRESLTIFAVDASGSSALSRLAEAKGAVEQMLAMAYVKRSQVALIAFRQTEATVLLPPTRSLTRARRALSALPGGGGTPLAAGLLAARQIAEAAQRHGQTPTIALLTDGKANVMIAGAANRAGAMDEVEQVARSVAAAGLAAIVIDISPRPRAEAEQLATQLRGRYLPLPRAQSAEMVAAIESVGEGKTRL